MPRNSETTDLDTPDHDLFGAGGHGAGDSGLPRLVRVYLRQIVIGFGLSAVFVGLLLGVNVANLRTLVTGTQGGAIAVFLLFFFNGLVFAGVQFGITIMRMAAPEDKGPRGGRRAPKATSTPVRVDVTAGR